MNGLRESVSDFRLGLGRRVGAEREGSVSVLRPDCPSSSRRPRPASSRSCRHLHRRASTSRPALSLPDPRGRRPGLPRGGGGCRCRMGWSRSRRCGRSWRRTLRRGVGGVDRPAHEEDLAREVGVVGAGRGARFDQRLAVLEVGPDGGRHDLRRLGERLDRATSELSATTSGQSTPSSSARALELRRGPPAERDPDVGGSVVGEVLGGQEADEAGGSVDDDVVVTSRNRS